MKLVCLLLMAAIIQVSASSFAQKVSLNVKDASLEDVLLNIQKQSGYDFLYSSQVLEVARPVTLTIKNSSVTEALEKCLATQPFTFLINQKTITIVPKPQPQKPVDVPVSGKITDDKGEPLPGVTISVKGAQNSVIADKDGNYRVVVDGSNKILVYSFIGFETQEIAVGGSQVIDVVMKPATTALDQVVVVGYGAQRKKDILGAVAVVDVKAMRTIPTGSAEQALQGQAAGVNIITSGVPGGASNIFIRGITSFGDTQPLVIVDGVQGSLHDLNMNDIESVQVLKDAGSAAIYGVRGSNGVVVVTTKKGKVGTPVISYESYFGEQMVPGGNVFNLLNSQELAAVTKTARPGTVLFANGVPQYLYGSANGGGIADANSPLVDPSKYVFDPKDPTRNYIIQKANQEGTDWFHEVFRDAPIQSHSITASGGTKTSNYLFSLGYLNQKGTLRGTYLKRYSARINTQTTVKNHIRLGENAYLFYKQNPGYGNQDQNNTIAATFRTNPIIPVYDIQGNYGGTFAGTEMGQVANPLASQERTVNNRNNSFNIVGNAYAEADFLKHFTARTSFGGSIENQNSLNFAFNEYNSKQAYQGTNSLAENASFNTNWIWTNTLTYSNRYGNHNVKLLGGSEAIEWYGRNLSGSATDFAATNMEYLILNNGTRNLPTSDAYSESLFSLFSRLDYSYNDKYLFGATVRRDGSSKFGSESRYGVFPSLSAGWRISEEGFLKNRATWLNDLKLRGSWGKLGAQGNVDRANQYTLYNSGLGTSWYDINGTGNIVLGYYAARFGNAHTSWEEDVITNLGVDVTAFNNTLNLSVEWYKKSINGLLFVKELPSITGEAAPPATNLGDIENRGWDISAGYQSRNKGPFQYNVGLNITTYKNLVKNVPGDFFNAGGSSIGAMVRNEVGHPVGAFWGYDISGLFQSDADVTNSPIQDGAAPGRFKYRDVTGDGKITPDDRTFIGNPNPDFTYGINLGASYKNFDFSMIFYGSQGNDVVNYVRSFTDFFPTPSAGKGKALLNAWTPQNLSATTPKLEGVTSLSTTDVFNSYYIENGSFLKCRSVLLGYTFNPLVLKKVGIDKLRLYLQAANLFTITKYTGLDPELTASAPNQGTGDRQSAAFGIDYGNYPSNQKNFIFGLNVTF